MAGGRDEEFLMKVQCKIDNDGVMEWSGHEMLPGAVFDKLEDAFACFPHGSVLTVEFEKDVFTHF